MLGSDVFRTSPQLVAFLKFVMLGVLRGEGASLKGYTIAVEALEREKDFKTLSCGSKQGGCNARSSDTTPSLAQIDSVLIDVPRGG